MSRWNGITVTLPAGEELRCEPATAERFADVPAVLGERGGPGGCWCMFWRQRTAEWRADGSDAAQGGVGRSVRRFAAARRARLPR